MMTALKKYLAQHAEADIQWLEQAINHSPFQQALVIPVYRENTAVIDRFADFAEKNPGSLLIIVINRPDTDPETDWAEALFAHPLFNPHTLVWQSAKKRMGLYRLAHHSGILLVDRCIHGPAIPKDQGVGLARKTGADILCQLITWGLVKSPWIANTDADAWLPVDYFSALKTLNNTAAVVYPFEHIIVEHTVPKEAPKEDSYLLLPALLYEFSLHYYVCGLSQAGSPYAFHTIGSTIAVHYQHYAKVRGFPKRAGAEDFYLLNKVAKTGLIKTLEQPLIQLQARTSTRVPFGTGPAISKLAASSNPLFMPLYHPNSFLYLQFFLQLLVQLATKNSDLVTEANQLMANEETEARAATINLPLLSEIAESLKLPQAMHHCHHHGKDTATRLQHLHHWFDGFKTLKFIHQLRDRQLGTISFQQWLGANDNYPLSSNETMNMLIQRIKTIT